MIFQCLKYSTLLKRLQTVERLFVSSQNEIKDLLSSEGFKAGAESRLAAMKKEFVESDKTYVQELFDQCRELDCHDCPYIKE